MLKLEAMGFAADGSREEFDIALRRAVRTYASNVIGQEVWADVRDTFESFVVFSAGGLSYGADYKFESGDSGYTFTFSNPQFVQRSITYKEKGAVDSASRDDYTVEVRTESINDPGEVQVSVETSVWFDKTKNEVVCLESVMTQGDKHVLELTGSVIFEQGLEATKKFFEENGFIRGRAPTINIGQYTENGMRYLMEAASHLERDIGRMLVSKRSKSKLHVRKGPWVDGIMYATHGPAVKNVDAKASGRVLEDSDRLLAIASKVTGTYREGNWLGITFETIQTQAGKDIAILLMEGLIPGVSLRAIAKDEVPNERGGFDVKRLHIEGFGVDFTTKPAMVGAEAKGIKLESRSENDNGSSDGGDELKIEEVKTLDDLKAYNKELWEEVNEKIKNGEDSATALTVALATAAEAEARLEASNDELKEARKVLAESSGAKVLTAWGENLKSDKALSSVSQASLLKSGTLIVNEQAGLLLESRKELRPNTQDFQDALTSKASPLLDSRKDDLKKMVAEELRARNITEGVGDLSNTTPAPDGTAGVFNTIDTLDPRHELIESENEMVGLPRSPHGTDPKPAPIKDCILSKAYGIPVYEDQGGVSVPIGATPMPDGDPSWPSRMAAARACQEIYESEPFMVRIGGGQLSWTDALLRDSDAYKIVEKLRNRVKLEANEMTTLATLGTLFPDIRQGIIEAAFAQTKWLGMTTVVPTGSPEYQVWEEEYTRTGEHGFGVIAVGAGITGTDDGPVTRPMRLYIKINTAYDVAETITITGTDQKGTGSKTWAANVTTAMVAGTVSEARPTVTGQRCLDVASAVDLDAASAGEVKIFGYAEPDAGSQTELVVSQNAKSTLVRRTGTVGEFDMEVEMSWHTIEDAIRSLATVGPGRYDVAAAMTRLLSKDFANSIDSRGFTSLNASANYDSGNDLAKTYTIGTDAVAEGQNLSLHYDLVKLNEKIADWGEEKPTRLAINDTDTHKLLWMRGEFITRFQNRFEAFASGLAWGTVAGMTVVDCRYQPHEVMYAMSPGRVFHCSYIPLEFRGPFSYVASQKTDIFVGRMRSEDVFTKPRTRGRLVITEA